MSTPVVLDPAQVSLLWERLGRSYAAVARHLADHGVRNPSTGRPYTRSAIHKCVQQSGAAGTPEERQAAIARSRSALRAAVAAVIGAAGREALRRVG